MRSVAPGVGVDVFRGHPEQGTHLLGQHLADQQLQVIAVAAPCLDRQTVQHRSRRSLTCSRQGSAQARRPALPWRGIRWWHILDEHPQVLQPARETLEKIRSGIGGHLVEDLASGMEAGQVHGDQAAAQAAAVTVPSPWTGSAICSGGSHGVEGHGRTLPPPRSLAAPDDDPGRVRPSGAEPLSVLRIESPCSRGATRGTVRIPPADRLMRRLAGCLLVNAPVPRVPVPR